MNKPEYATLICTHNGSDKLPIVAKSLINSEFPPKKIYVVGTSECDIINILKIPEISEITEFILSPIANQVVQRIIGITHIKEDIILQTDDDLIFKRDCTRNLYDYLTSYKDIIVSPLILNKENDICCKRWLETYKKLKLFRLYLAILGWKYGQSKPQSILINGSIVPMVSIPTHPIEVDWICSTRMYWKKDIKSINYPLKKGKSWFEDVFSSIELRKKLGKKLFLIPSASIIQEANDPISSKIQLSLIKHQLDIARKTNGSILLAIIDCISTAIVRALK